MNPVQGVDETEGILFIYKLWPTALPINKVTHNHSTLRISPIEPKDR